MSSTVLRIAGTIKLCPECNMPYDDLTRLKNHCSTKHGHQVTAALPETI